MSDDTSRIGQVICRELHNEYQSGRSQLRRYRHCNGHAGRERCMAVGRHVLFGRDFVAAHDHRFIGMQY